MGVKAEVVRDGRVVIQIYTDPLDMKEIMDQYHWIRNEIIEHATKKVHTIIDMRQVTKIPSNMLRHGAQPLKETHPMGGQIVLVINNPVVNALADVFTRIVRNYEIKVYKTIEQAWEYYDRVLAEEDKLIQK
jgi:hypothetical protein